MIFDELTEFADATALGTSGTGLALVGDVIDLGAASRDIGVGKPLYVVIQVDTAVGSSSTASVAFVLASDAQAAIATDGSATVHVQTASITKGSLVAGYTFIVPLPQGQPAYERYLGILQDVSTTALNAGKINAFLTSDPTNWKAYAEGSHP